MSLTFHRTFSLSRPLLTQVIRTAEKVPGFTQATLARETDLGSVQQEAMPRYAYRAGLLDAKKHLTLFGEFVAQFDSALETSGTQWLLHYHLSAPHGHTAFWRYLVTTHFLSGNVFTSQELMDSLAEFLSEETGKVPAPRYLRSAVTIFIGSYLKTEGLYRLHVLEEIEQNTYQVLVPPLPPVWALGYALTDYWKAQYGERLTINLTDITQGDFASIFLLGENRLTELLMELKREGIIDLYRTSRPYQIVLLQPDPKFALEKLYGV